MKTPYIISLGASALLVGGCATQPGITFWERRGDTVLVHHFDGLNDHVETLSNKKLASTALKPDSFPKGQYFAVGQKDFQVKKIAVPHSSAKDSASDSDKLAAANKELHSLRNRLNEAEAENQRLQAQIAKPSDNQSLSAANGAAMKEEPQLIEETHRLSQ
jgi:hypothetical protein